MAKYEFREGSRITGVEPETAGKELERIRKKVGLTPRNIVVESKPARAPLHRVFEWNDTVAANSFREQQARHLVRAVVIRQDEEAEATPVYVHVRNQTNKNDIGTYEPVGLVVERIDMFTSALDELVEKMNAAARAVRQLEDAAKRTDDHDRMAQVAMVVKAIDMATEAVRALH